MVIADVTVLRSALLTTDAPLVDSIDVDGDGSAASDIDDVSDESDFEFADEPGVGTDGDGDGDGGGGGGADAGGGGSGDLFEEEDDIPPLVGRQDSFEQLDRVRRIRAGPPVLPETVKTQFGEMWHQKARRVAKTSTVAKFPGWQLRSVSVPATHPVWSCVRACVRACDYRC